MKFIIVCVPLLALACTGVEHPVGNILVIAQAQTATAQITRVTVTTSLLTATTELNVDLGNPGKFTGTLVVPVGTQTVTVEAFNGNVRVGTGSTSVTVTKGEVKLTQITILDSTGPAPGPDHSPVVTSLVTPVSLQVGDASTLTTSAMDADGDPVSFSWAVSPSGCGALAPGTGSSTDFTAVVAGNCTVTVTAMANGKSASKSAPIRIDPATGSIDVTVQYVPHPVISSISFSSGATTLATVTRNASDATIRTPFKKGTAYTVTLGFDPWPTGSVALSDSCGGTIQPQPLLFVANATMATATWTPGAGGDVCLVTATLTRETLTDTLFVVVLPVP
jgi:hypothetical protein